MSQIKNDSVKRLVTTGLCLALGLLLPGFFHLFGGAGAIFLPMHIPVLICGLLCGWRYGSACGIIVVVLSSTLTGMPPLYPVGVSMIFELAAYGCISGILHKRFGLYPSLVVAMLIGRAVSGIANTLLYGVGKETLTAFLTGAFITALPGILIQLIFVPLIVKAVEHSRLSPINT